MQAATHAPGPHENLPHEPLQFWPHSGAVGVGVAVLVICDTRPQLPSDCGRQFPRPPTSVRHEDPLRESQAPGVSLGVSVGVGVTHVHSLRQAFTSREIPVQTRLSYRHWHRGDHCPAR